MDELQSGKVCAFAGLQTLEKKHFGGNEMSKSKREKLRAKQQRKALQTRLIWGGLGAIVLAALGLLVFQGVRPATGDEVAIPANYGEHLEEGVDPGPFGREFKRFV